MYEKGQTTTSLSLDQLNKNYPLSSFQVTPSSTPGSSETPEPTATGNVPAVDFRAGGTGIFLEHSIQCISINDGVSF